MRVRKGDAEFYAVIEAALNAVQPSCSQLNARVRDFFPNPQQRPQDTKRPTRQ
jgi:hypothetical protein